MHSNVSLGEVHETIDVGAQSKVAADPGILWSAISLGVGYMDPGNWATDLAGGSKFGYKLMGIIDE
jgi:manganese transport protein